MMRTLCGFVCLVLTFLCATAQAEDGSLKLAENGKARAVIVVPTVESTPDGNLIASKMATVLAWHLERMTGASFETVRESELGDASVEGGRLKVTKPREGKD